VFFFFSSRRRHTRFKCDWSSDVCSSDLMNGTSRRSTPSSILISGYVYPWVPRPEIWIEDGVDRREVPFIVCHEYVERRLMRDARSEERRVGKECRARWTSDSEKRIKRHA